jgi:large subunit ribosomal protein L9
MKVFLLKDVDKVGVSGEVIKVKEGFALNFLVPQKYGVIITAENEANFKNKIKSVENRKEVISSKTSMLAEKIKALKLVIKKKAHDKDKLYGAITNQEVADLLEAEGVKIAKSQVIFDKAVKTIGLHEVTIKLSNQLLPKVSLKVAAE